MIVRKLGEINWMFLSNIISLSIRGLLLRRKLLPMDSWSASIISINLLFPFHLIYINKTNQCKITEESQEVDPEDHPGKKGE